MERHHIYYDVGNFFSLGHGTSKWLCWGLHRGMAYGIDEATLINHCYFTMQDHICMFRIISFLFEMQAIIKKRPSRNINVQNFWLYVFGMIFNLIAICVQDYDAVMNK